MQKFLYHGIFIKKLKTIDELAPYKTIIDELIHTKETLYNAMCKAIELRRIENENGNLCESCDNF